MDKSTIYIYTDGACRNNQEEKNIGAWGAYIFFNGHEKKICGVEENTTNNIMELKSVIEALKTIKEKARDTIPVVVISDSNYVVQGINEWVYKWLLKKWTNSNKEPVKNKELWEELVLLKIKFIDIKFEWCKGHENNSGNIEADRICNEAIDEYLFKNP